MKRFFRLFLVGAALILAAGCYDPLADWEPPPMRTYQYEVTGAGGNFSVTIENKDGNTQQWADVDTGWTYTWDQRYPRWLYVSAQNGTDYGDVTVRITRDGETLVENTSYGAYVIATVSGEY